MNSPNRLISITMDLFTRLYDITLSTYTSTVLAPNEIYCYAPMLNRTVRMCSPECVRPKRLLAPLPVSDAAGVDHVAHALAHLEASLVHCEVVHENIPKK